MHKLRKKHTKQIRWNTQVGEFNTNYRNYCFHSGYLIIAALEVDLYRYIFIPLFFHTPVRTHLYNLAPSSHR